MACNCGKNIKSTNDIAYKMAQNESNIEKVKYVVYDYEGKTTYDRMECWQKDPKGEIRQIIYPI